MKNFISALMLLSFSYLGFASDDEEDDSVWREDLLAEIREYEAKAAQHSLVEYDYNFTIEAPIPFICEGPFTNRFPDRVYLNIDMSSHPAFLKLSRNFAEAKQNEQFTWTDTTDSPDLQSLSKAGSTEVSLAERLQNSNLEKKLNQPSAIEKQPKSLQVDNSEMKSKPTTQKTLQETIDTLCSFTRKQ